MTALDVTLAVKPVPRARLPDWQLRFADLVAARLSAPFAWAQHDCCLWAADVVQAITGIDPAAHLRGQYTDEKSALRLVRSLGGLEGIASAALGAATTARFATVGDVVLITHERITTLAVCNGTSLLAPGAAGLQSVAMPVDCLAWRV